MEKPAEEQTEDYSQRTKEAEAKFNYHQTVENLNNPPSLREMQEKRLRDESEQRKAAEDRARQLEDDRLARIQEESAATAQEAQRQKELREKAEADLRTQQNQMILDEIKRLHELNVPPEKKLEEYFSFQEALERRFGKEKPAGPPVPAATDGMLMLELKKMEIGLEQWKVEMGFKKEDLVYKRELDKQAREDAKEMRMQELEVKKNQQQMFANLPKVFADTVAAGIMARASGGVSSEPSSISADPGAAAASHFEAEEGEAGELDCPVCKSKVGVGPTTASTVCAKCGRKFEIKRVPASVPAPAAAPANTNGLGAIL